MKRQYYPDIQDLVTGFTNYATTVLNRTLTKQPQASLVVPGGNTPRYFLPELAKCPLSWNRITVTLSDERWVDIDRKESNERLVRENLLAHLPDNSNFVGLKTTHSSPANAIDEVEQRLNTLYTPLSLTVLGLGEDGHIASLFPGTNYAKQETTHHCVAVDQPFAPSARISLSLSLLANSEHIALVVVGDQKRKLLDQLHIIENPKLPITWLTQRSNSPVTVFETNLT